MMRELDKEYKTHHSKHRIHNGGGQKSQGVQKMGKVDDLGGVNFRNL